MSEAVKVSRKYCLDHAETKYHLAGQAFHTSYCHICGRKMEFATTYDELLCIKCSSKYNQCAKCGRVITDRKSEELLALEKLDRLEKWLDNEINQRKKDQLEYGALIRIEDQIILLKEVREVLNNGKQ